MVKIYGCSDDLVEIENSKYYENEIDCFDEKVTIWFTDDTTIEIEYGSEGIWKIKKIEDGTAESVLTECNDPYDDFHSDVFEIDAEIENHCVGEINWEVQDLKKTFRELKKNYCIQDIEKAYNEVFGL